MIRLFCMLSRPDNRLRSRSVIASFHSRTRRTRNRLWAKSFVFATSIVVAETPFSLRPQSLTAIRLRRSALPRRKAAWSK